MPSSSLTSMTYLHESACLPDVAQYIDQFVRPALMAQYSKLSCADISPDSLRELRKLKYDPADKDMDIHQFIGKVNSLADKAGIAKAERKIVLYEHIPADLDLRLPRDSKDATISYEDFAGAVADAADAKQRACDERLEKKHASRDHNESLSTGSRFFLSGQYG
jgi:hypothetical protein